MIPFKLKRIDFLESFYSVTCTTNGRIVNRKVDMSLDTNLCRSEMEQEKDGNRSIVPKSRWTIKKNRELLISVNQDKLSWEEVSRLLDIGVKASDEWII